MFAFFYIQVAHALLLHMLHVLQKKKKNNQMSYSKQLKVAKSVILTVF